MKVILTKDVPKIGRRGELKDIADGYAKNFLISKGLAILANSSEGKSIAKISKDKVQSHDLQKEKSQKIKSKIENKTIVLKLEKDKNGKAYGSITEKNLLDQIEKKFNVELEKNCFKTHIAFRESGEYNLTAHLPEGIKAEIKVKIE